MKDLEKILKGLANRRRLAIVKILLKKKGLSVAEIAGAIHLSLKATSKHLTILRQIDVVDRGQVGLNAYYRISSSLPDVVRSLQNYVSNSRE